MKAIIKYSCIILLSLAAYACRTADCNPSEYAAAIEKEEGLQQKKTVGPIDYTFKLLTPELLALKAAYDGDRQRIDPLKYKQRLRELQGHLYVNIDMQADRGQASIMKYQVKTPEQYQQRVMYYEFYAKDDIRLVSGGAEVPAVSYQYENHLDLMPYNTILLAFPMPKGTEDFQVVFNDKAFNNLFVKASFNIKALNSLPNLTLN